MCQNSKSSPKTESGIGIKGMERGSFHLFSSKIFGGQVRKVRFDGVAFRTVLCASLDPTFLRHHFLALFSLRHIPKQLESSSFFFFYVILAFKFSWIQKSSLSDSSLIPLSFEFYQVNK